jgi:hypothetical protein
MHQNPFYTRYNYDMVTATPANVLNIEFQPEEQLVPEHSPDNDNEEGSEATGEETRVMWSRTTTPRL